MDKFSQEEIELIAKALDHMILAYETDIEDEELNSKPEVIEHFKSQSECYQELLKKWMDEFDIEEVC